MPVSSPTPRSRKSTESRMDMNILKQACLVINTADYCQTTSAELEQKMREQVDEAYKEQISFQAEADYFVRFALLFLDIIYLTGC